MQCNYLFLEAEIKYDKSELFIDKIINTDLQVAFQMGSKPLWGQKSFQRRNNEFIPHFQESRVCRIYIICLALKQMNVHKDFNFDHYFFHTVTEIYVLWGKY